jgi:AraC-like DNA-binding protein
MRFFSRQPAPPLGDFIDNLWYCTDAPSHPKERILPSGMIELVINLREDQVRIHDSVEPKGYRSFPGVVISGTYAGAFVIDPSQHASIMGVHFRHGGAYPFIGGAVGELANSHLALEVLWGRDARELRDRLCSAATPQTRFQILEEALQARLRWLPKQPAVSLALDGFGPAGIGDSVRAVAKQVGLSQRRFIQVFTAQVGLTPKLFCRILRFQHARKFVDQAATLNWGQLALACGYYDQSHLIHDFQEFSGLSPTDYLCLRSSRLLQNHVRLLG